VRVLADRLYHTHVKNGYNREGRWDFRYLDDGCVDYAPVLAALREIGYDGYLSIECLGPQAAEEPVQTAACDLETLRTWLS